MKLLESPKQVYFKQPRVTASPSLKNKIDNGSNVNHKKRLVVVSPYASFNFILEYIIGKIDSEGKMELDFVSTAEMPQRPFIDVKLREKSKESIPHCVIDFFRIGLKQEESYSLQRFTDYSLWVTETIKSMQGLKTRYLIPKQDRELLVRSSAYEVGSKFDPYSFRVSDLEEELRRDIARIIRNSDEGFDLFSECVPKSEN